MERAGNRSKREERANTGWVKDHIRAWHVELVENVNVVVVVHIFVLFCSKEDDRDEVRASPRPGQARREPTSVQDNFM